jgi:hypothetical protein
LSWSSLAVMRLGFLRERSAGRTRIK